MKILPVGTELFHVDRRTDMTKLRVAFRNFANAPKKEKITIFAIIRDSSRNHSVLTLPAMNPAYDKPP
jgi:hypothetical protein